jgi:hypothetical protein
MKRMKSLQFVIVIILLMVAAGATSNYNHKPETDFLSVLKEGQVVSVKEVAEKFEILILEKIPVGSKITEIGTDYIMFEDPSGVSATRVHITSIKSIVRLTVPKE